MFDKRKPSDDGSAAALQGADKKDKEEEYIRPNSSSSGHEGPSQSVLTGNHRQGYCSCCQVHYVDLDKHLTSTQHRHMTLCHKKRFSTSILMDRFLQDVHRYHPQNYQDTRPTYDDIPDIIRPPASLKDCSCLPPPYTEEKTHFDASTGVPGVADRFASGSSICSPNKSKHSAKKIPLEHPLKKKCKKEQCSLHAIPQQSKLILINSQNALYTAVNTIPHSSPLSTVQCYSNSPLTANKTISSETTQTKLYQKDLVERKECGMCTKCPVSEQAVSPTRGLQINPLDSQAYCYNLSGISDGRKSGFKTQGKTDYILGNHMLGEHWKNCHVFLGSEHESQTQGEGLCKNDKTVDEIIEEVIWMHCYGTTPKESHVECEESVSSLNVNSIVGALQDSNLSFDWDMPVQSGDDNSKVIMKNWDLLKEMNVSLGEDYESKLTSVLSANPVKEVKDVKLESEEAVLPSLPHVPPSFVGKTWSQIMYEDDLKIDDLVKQFKNGKFHCYFENGSLAGTKRKSKNRHTKEEIKVKMESQSKIEEDLEINKAPVSLHEGCDGSDIPSLHSEKALKPDISKPGRRIWRLASRCQIVKVSHGTQTSLLNYHTGKRKVITDDFESECKQDIHNFEDERTPDIKTRMCALRLPESYNKILTPVQPKTVVYVLSHPDSKQDKGKPACISKQGRNKFSTESRDSVYFKYKQSPLKYYDPLTNRILKTPPKNTVQGMDVKGPHVRKLFRSLSSDVNKLQFKQKKSTTCKKSMSSCSFASLYADSTKGNQVSLSVQGSESSSNTEFTDSLKLGDSDKPYGHISISPCSTHKAQFKTGIQLTPIIARTRNIQLRSKKNLLPKTGNLKASKKKTRKKSEPENNTESNTNHCGMIRMVQQVAQRRSHRKKKSSINVRKTTVPLVQACIPRQNTPKKGLRNNLPASESVHTLVKSQYFSLKPTWRKPKMTKPVQVIEGHRKSRGRTCTVAKARESKETVKTASCKRKSSRTVPCTAKRQETRLPKCRTRTHLKRNTRRRVT